MSDMCTEPGCCDNDEANPPITPRDWRETHFCTCGHPTRWHGLLIGAGVACADDSCCCEPIRTEDA